MAAAGAHPSPDDGAALAIGCFASICRDQLGDRLLAFTRLEPGVDLGVHEMPRGELLAGVRGGQLSLAVVPGGAQAGLQSATLWADAAVVALAAEHPLARLTAVPPRALLGERLLISRQEHGGDMHRFLANRIAPLTSLPGELCNLGLPQLLARVAAGEGVALTCASHTASLRKGVVTRPLATPDAKFQVNAYWREAEPRWPLDRLIATLQDKEVVDALGLEPRTR